MTELLVQLTPQSAYELLLVEIALGVMLLLGWALARLGHIRAHRAIQSTIVLVNIPLVIATMVPQYLVYGVPSTFHEVEQPFYLYALIMLVAGAAAEALGVYIVLVAGTNWIPERLRFRRYKSWMRTELALWWIVLLAGVATYYFWWVSY